MAVLAEPVRTDGGPQRLARNTAALRAQERSEHWMLAAWRCRRCCSSPSWPWRRSRWLFWLSFRDAGRADAGELRADAASRPICITLRTTFELSFLVTIICILLGYPLAYITAQARPRMAALLLLSSCFRSGPRCWCASTPGWCCCSGAG